MQDAAAIIISGSVVEDYACTAFYKRTGQGNHENGNDSIVVGTLTPTELHYSCIPLSFIYEHFPRNHDRV